MPNAEPNYVKEVLTSQWNLAFVGIMFLLMVTINFIGFGALLVGGEVAAILLAQLPAVQHYIRLKAQISDQENIKTKEQEIVASLPMHYNNDYQTVKRLCDEIEERWKKQGNQKNYLLSDLINKLGLFRFEYARMLQAHHLTSSRDVVQLTKRLQSELEQNEQALEREKSPQVRDVLAQNIRIIRQRLQRTMQLSDLLRLLAARLSVVRNSLNLLHDEVYTVADPTNVSSQVDNLLLTLNIDEELKAAYEDVLGAREAAALPVPDQQQNKKAQAQQQSNLRRIK